MEKQEEKFRCPYCGKKKDVIELNYNTELGNFEPTLEKFGNIRDAYDYKHINYKYTRYEVPICDDCLIIHQAAGSKGTIIAFVLFLPIAFFLLYYALKTGGGFWDFIIPTGLVGIVCLGIRLLIKIFLISRKGINYRANKAFISASQDAALDKLFNSQFREENLYDAWEKEWEKNKKMQEDWEKHHTMVKVDLGNGQFRYDTRYVSDTELKLREELKEKEKGNVDFSKVRKLEEGASIDYSDDDFEGHFV